MHRQLLLFVLYVGTVNQAAHCQATDQTIANLVKVYDAQDAQGKLGTFLSPQTWLQAATAQQAPSVVSIKAAVAPAIAQSRTDQQTTASAGTSGTTSAASKGSVPWLLSLAEEYGGLTQSVAGSVTTVQGNIANIIKAINAKEYEKSFAVAANNPFVRSVSKASFSVGLKTGTDASAASSSAQPSTFSSATVHIDLFNHRDPRDNHWSTSWSQLVQEQGKGLEDEADRESALWEQTEEYNNWKQRTRQALMELEQDTQGLQSTDRDKKVAATLQTILDDFKKSKGISLAAFETQLRDYRKTKQTIADEINKSGIFSFEYTFTDQSSVNLPKSSTQTYAIGTTAPNLSNFNLIFSGPLSRNGAVQITANGSATLFMSASSQLHLAPVRDYKFATEVDIPIPGIASLAKSTISLSALFQGLLQEPLGQQVTVNGVAVKNTGNIVLGQAKWSFPVGATGIVFPVSITASNRTDLIKEKDVRGTIGVSYNLDSLFSKQ